MQRIMCDMFLEPRTWNIYNSTSIYVETQTLMEIQWNRFFYVSASS